MRQLLLITLGVLLTAASGCEMMDDANPTEPTPVIDPVVSGPSLEGCIVLIQDEINWYPVDLKGTVQKAEYSVEFQNTCTVSLVVCSMACYTVDGRRVACEAYFNLMHSLKRDSYALFDLGTYDRSVSIEVQLQYEWDDSFERLAGTVASCERHLSPVWP